MPCSENQTCINTTDGFECECSPGFTLINSTCIKGNHVLFVLDQVIIIHPLMIFCTVGSCADIGYDGCCNDLSTRCKGSDDKCYCDQACYGLNDWLFWYRGYRMLSARWVECQCGMHMPEYGFKLFQISMSVKCHHVWKIKVASIS